MAALVTRYQPRRVVRARDLYALPEEDSEYIESLEFKQQCVMIRSRLNLPCETEEDGHPKPISRTTVKHVHARFEDICQRFEFLFDRADDREHWGVVNALIYVLGELCPDSVLCDMFFERLQLFPRLTWLLRGPIRVPWYYPLELLCMIVRRGNDSTRLAVARRGDVLNVLFLSHLSSFRAVEFNSIIISHALEAAFAANPPDPDLVSSIPLLQLVDDVESGLSLHHETFTHRCATHGLVVLGMGRFRHELDHPSRGVQRSLDFFAALSKLQDLSIRALALRLFFPHKFTGNVSRSSDIPTSDQDCLPSHLRELLVQYGSPGSELELIRAAKDAFRAATSALFRDQDLLKFGSAVAGILQQGTFVLDELKDSFTADDGLPYASLCDCLLATVTALRETGGSSVQDIADTVELGRLAILGDHAAVVASARAALARNPQLTFASVMLSGLLADREEALRIAKDGLEFADDSPYLRRELLLSAMDASFRKGYTLLICGDLEDPERRGWGKQGIFSGAQYMDELLHDCTPPLDSLDLWLTLHWQFIHAILTADDDLEAVVTSLKSTLLPRLEACESLLEARGYDVKGSTVRRGREAYLAHLNWPSDITNYSDWIKRFDSFTKEFRAPFDNPAPGAEAEDILYTRWWNVAEKDLVPATTHGPLQCGCRSSREMWVGSVVLGKCNWCRKPSAILKQCARCRDVLYCDGKCQRQDWSRHKERCRRIADESHTAVQTV
ncbi:hypothetical protein OH76DRAFT_1403422 [Lentinus brumalis]|uniref:MYND-type domain-containing protein n=1 Tax=Lentinus brumalis TaxID=2498619 RepID=A0A371DBA1_9APHY|nr:hypothetical protein OH76DRAFT_1403422 [Polyporus brumalis]